VKNAHFGLKINNLKAENSGFPLKSNFGEEFGNLGLKIPFLGFLIRFLTWKRQFWG